MPRFLFRRNANVSQRAQHQVYTESSSTVSRSIQREREQSNYFFYERRHSVLHKNKWVGTQCCIARGIDLLSDWIVPARNRLCWGMQRAKHARPTSCIILFIIFTTYKIERLRPNNFQKFNSLPEIFLISSFPELKILYLCEIINIVGCKLSSVNIYFCSCKSPFKKNVLCSQLTYFVSPSIQNPLSASLSATKLQKFTNYKKRAPAY